MQKILLLEDDASLIDGLEYSLKKKNFSVDTARSLAEARTLLSSVSYTLLLLDVTLPDGNGVRKYEKTATQYLSFSLRLLTKNFM